MLPFSSNLLDDVFMNIILNASFFLRRSCKKKLAKEVIVRYRKTGIDRRKKTKKNNKVQIFAGLTPM